MEKAMRSIGALRAVGWETAGYRFEGGAYIAVASLDRRFACVSARSLEDAWPELWVLVATIRQRHRIRE